MGPETGELAVPGPGTFPGGGRDDPFALEPLYLRPSAAEEKWALKGS